MLITLFVLLTNVSWAQGYNEMFCEPSKGQGKTDLIWVQTFTQTQSEASYKGLIKASHRSYGVLSADINQIEWVFKDITVPTQELENSSAYRLIYRETGWTLDEFSDEYQKTFLLDCRFNP